MELTSEDAALLIASENVHLKGEERETNKMQLICCLLSNYLNMFRASLCPSSGEQ
jgi:hypothetical protein